MVHQPIRHSLERIAALGFSELLFESLAAHGNAAALWLIEGLGHGFLQRPHLDEGPVRRRVERSCVPGRSTVTSEAATPIFAAIRTFLGEALGKAGTSIERANADPR